MQPENIRPAVRHIPLVAATLALACMVLLASQVHTAASTAWPLVAPLVVLASLIVVGLTEPQFTVLGFSLCAASALAYVALRFPNDVPLWSVAIVVPLGTASGEMASSALAYIRRLRRRDRERAEAMEQLAATFAGLAVDASLAEIGSVLARAASNVLDSPEVEVRLHRNEREGGAVLVGRRPANPDRHVELASATAQWGSIVLAPGRSAVDPAIQDLFARQAVNALERHHQLRTLDEAAHRDPLTGAGNRRHAELLLARLRPGDALALVDIDHFKLVNDTTGHRSGDDLLISLGQYLSVFGGQLVSRYGGDEFLVVLAACEDLAATAEGLITGWRASGGDGPTISVGVSMHQAGRSAVDTLEAADRALYQAKRAGRDTVAIDGTTKD